MQFGFIGAGKVGFSMGKYLTERNERVTGYYSRSSSSSADAAQFTGTTAYETMEALVSDSDAIFVTVPDGEIPRVWQQLIQLPIQGKLILHCSGLLSSDVFSGIERVHAYGYSIHPLLAICDRYTSYTALSSAFFALEGDEKHLLALRDLFCGFGNRVGLLKTENKVLYHAVAAMVSNLYVGLTALGEDLLRECGFSQREAHEAIAPLILGNAANLAAVGPIEALTGPIERNDVDTVCAHLACLPPKAEEIYRLLSAQVLTVAKAKHPHRDYGILEGELNV